VSAGGVPGFNLSEATHEELKGHPIKQLSAIIEPAKALGVPGLVLGARALGAGGDVSGLVVVHGTHASAEKNGASYEATRIGGELAADYRVLGAQPWVEP